MTWRSVFQGLKKIGELKPGETLVISGAAGSVGSVACQLGKAAGAKVYAIAGSDDKCQWLEKKLGVDRAFNYKSPNFFNDFKKNVGYLDVYFDNVGGMLNSPALKHITYRETHNRRHVGFHANATKQGCQNHSLWYAIIGPV